MKLLKNSSSETTAFRSNVHAVTHGLRRAAHFWWESHVSELVKGLFPEHGSSGCMPELPILEKPLFYLLWFSHWITELPVLYPVDIGMEKNIRGEKTFKGTCWIFHDGKGKTIHVWHFPIYEIKEKSSENFGHIYIHTLRVLFVSSEISFL